VNATYESDVSSNDKRWRHLSDILPSDKRTFAIKGLVKVTEASDGEVQFASRPATDADCTLAAAAAEAISVSPFKIDVKGLFDIR
jgi:hypothetical protein